jgi:RPA family protein
MPEFEAFERKHLKFLQEKEQVLVWGNVARKFESEKVSSITIDDFTETINVTAFKEQRHLLEKVNKGDRVQVIGETRLDRNEELYILPELVIKIDCWNELLKRLENLKFLKEEKNPEKELKIEKRII